MSANAAASAIGSLRRQAGRDYGYRPLGGRRFEVHIRGKEDLPKPEERTLTQEVVDILFAMKAQMPPGKPLRDAVRLYAMCLEKILA